MKDTNRHIEEWLFGILMALLLMTTVFPVHIALHRWLNNYAVLVMLGYLVVGLVFFMLGRQRLLFLAFLACGVLSVYLKYRTNPQVQLPRADYSAATFKVGHFNLSNLESTGAYEALLAHIHSTDFDLLSFQELTPYWKQRLEEDLKGDFPHLCVKPGVDLFGMGLYARHPFAQAYNYEVGGSPLIVCRMSTGPRSPLVHLVSVYNLPVLDQRSYQHLQEHLEGVAKFIDRLNGPIIVMGDFQVVSWSDELLNFKTALQLKDSRRGYMPSFLNGSVRLWEVPVDHIFYTRDFECTHFEGLTDAEGAHLGVRGTYQLKDEQFGF
ncbi:MAG: endonuclease/exonuclease/phosphatase family protein, partial [Phaeodactylibacter sp.]|nr:endonuclease/exonuclease/phosphatase family protein [Phaeodactylibacter sp.]